MARGPAARRGGAKGEGSPTVNPMMDGPQASCTPAPLSPSWIAVRRNSNGKTTKLRVSQGRRVSFQALPWGLAGWWRRAVPYPRAPVEPAGVRCWRRSRSVPSCRGSCGHSGPCGVEQDLGVCKKCAGASVQQHSRGRRTAGQERRSRRAHRGSLEAKRWVERHDAQHSALRASCWMRGVSPKAPRGVNRRDASAECAAS